MSKKSKKSKAKIPTKEQKSEMALLIGKELGIDPLTTPMWKVREMLLNQKQP